MKWVKDQKCEPFMRKLGIKFETETVQLSNIDPQEGLRRQARLIGKLNEVAVDTMAIQMLDEDAAFPMIILQKPPHGKMWVWSGNHRLRAFGEAWPAEKTIEAYVTCISDPVTIDMFPRGINCLESSIGFSHEERLANAVWMMEHHSVPAKEAGEFFGVKTEAIYSGRRAEQIKAELNQFGIKTNGMPKSTLNKLATESDNKNVLRASARVVAEYDLKGDEVARFIQDVKGEKTEGAKLVQIDKWAALLEERRKPKTGRKIVRKVRVETPIRERFLKDITDLAKVLEKYDTLEKLQCTDPADREILAKHWPMILHVMTKIAKQEVKS